MLLLFCLWRKIGETVEDAWPLRAPSTQLEFTDTVPVILYYFLSWKTKKRATY